MSSAVSICENIPPKPPTSPIPLRIAATEEDNLQKKQPLLSGNWSYSLSYEANVPERKS